MRSVFSEPEHLNVQKMDILFFCHALPSFMSVTSVLQLCTHDTTVYICSAVVVTLKKGSLVLKKVGFKRGFVRS